MGYPRERSRPSNARRQRRRSHGESISSADHEYANNINPVWSWLDNVDDPRSQNSRSTERVHHEPSPHSAKKYRKDEPRGDRNRVPEDLANQSKYKKQRNRREKEHQAIASHPEHHERLRGPHGSLQREEHHLRANLGGGSLAEDPSRAHQSENKKQRSRPEKGRQGRVSLTKDSEEGTVRPCKGSFSKHRDQSPTPLGSLAKGRNRSPKLRGSLANGHDPSPAHREHTGQPLYEPEQYDSNDHKHKQKSNKHKTNARSYSTGSGGRTRQHEDRANHNSPGGHVNYHESRPQRPSDHIHYETHTGKDRYTQGGDFPQCGFGSDTYSEQGDFAQDGFYDGSDTQEGHFGQHGDDERWYPPSGHFDQHGSDENRYPRDDDSTQHGFGGDGYTRHNDSTQYERDRNREESSRGHRSKDRAGEFPWGSQTTPQPIEKVPDYYAIIGCSIDDEIATASRKAKRKQFEVHPDRVGVLDISEERTAEITSKSALVNEIAEVMKDAQEKERYDRKWHLCYCIENGKTVSIWSE